MLTSILKKEDGYTALCNDCGLPIVRSDDARWTIAEPLVSRRDEAA
jgi:hypothetical protein